MADTVKTSSCTPFFFVAIAAAFYVGCSDPQRGHGSETPGTLYLDVTGEAGLGDFTHVTGARGDVWFPETMGSGGGFADFTGDGYPDILLVGGGTWAPDPPVQALHLYRNNRDGSFSDVSEEVGLASLAAYGMGITAADFDNDGDVDLYLTVVGPNVLFRNDDGVFVDITEQAGVGGGPQWSTSALFFDADRDGWLDLFVGNYVDWSPETDIPCRRETGEKAYCTPEVYTGLAPHFYRNRGDGTFADQSREAGFNASAGKTLGVVELDFNHDGWPDLALANDTEGDQLYVNRGDGSFVDRGLLAGIAFDEQGKARAGMGIDAGDVDGDGHVTVFVGNFASEMIAAFRYEGDGRFSDRAAVWGIGQPSLATLTFGLLLLDVDLDGDLDLFAANGHIDPDVEKYRDNITFRQRPHLFLNEEGTFRDVAGKRDDALAEPLAARGAAYADFDMDGDLDLLITENGGRAHLWRNEVEGANFLRVKLTGRESNRDALGSSVEVIVGAERQRCRVNVGGSYLSVSEQSCTFGLGGVARIDTISVTWPNGAVQRIGGVAANQELHLVQGE